MKTPIVAAVAAFTTVVAAWGSQSSYNVPGTSDNVCTEDQSAGVDFSSAASGSLSSYKGINFGPGWSCGSGFSKRSLSDTTLFRRALLGRWGGGGGGGGQDHGSPSSGSGGGFGGNCAMADSGKSPSLASDNDFTIGHVKLQPERDCNLEMHYNIPGQSQPCKETASFAANGGTEHSPTLCAGANQMSIVMPSASKAAYGSCSVAIHSISYICTTHSSTSSKTSTTKITTETTSTQSTTTGTTETTPTTTPSTYTTPGTTSPTTQTTETTETTGTTETSGVTNTPSTSLSTMYTMNTTAPVTTPTVPVSTAPVSTAPVSTAPVTTTPSTMMTPTTGMIPTGSCPAVVPQCLNSFLYIPGCSNNADTQCMCYHGEFVAAVMACINSYGGADVHIAVGYFQGLCAAAMPSVPAYLSCPSSYNSVAGYTAPTNAAPNTMPMTTVPITQVTTMPATYSTGPQSGQPIPSSTITSTITTNQAVPAVTLAGSSLLPASNSNAPATDTCHSCACPTCGAPTSGSTAGSSVAPTSTSPAAIQAGADRPQVAMAGSVAMAVLVALFGM